MPEKDYYAENPYISDPFEYSGVELTVEVSEVIYGKFEPGMILKFNYVENSDAHL